MDAMSEVEELSLSWTNIIDGKEKVTIRGGFDLQKDFEKLKCLDFSGGFDASGIGDKISDNSLEALVIKSDFKEWPNKDRLEKFGRRGAYERGIQAAVNRQTNEERLQVFVNRQTELKKLAIPTGIKLNLDHLALEELTLHIKDDKLLAKILKQQPTLRVLLGGPIGWAAFKELRKMPNLEVLRGEFPAEVTGELRNLKELRVSGDCFIVEKVALPKLITFKLHEGDPHEDEECRFIEHNTLEAEQVLALSRNAPNLQNIAIRNNSDFRNSYLPTIIDNFMELESLRLEPLKAFWEFPQPTRHNLSLKKLIIHRQQPLSDDLDASFYATIAWCPSLERISLHDIIFTKHEILNLIESRPQLTHFSFGFEHGKDLFNEQGADFLDPVLLAIIDVFRNSPAFVFLRFYSIAEFGKQLLEDALAGDVGRIEVTKFAAYKCHSSTSILWRRCNFKGQQCGFSLSKNVEDPFKNFCNDKISADF